MRRAAPLRPMLPRAAALALALAAGCAPDGTAPARPTSAAPAPPVGPGLGSMPRLTRAQYANAVHDLLGPEVVVPTALEPDAVIERSVALGVSDTALSRRGVEQYERAAYALAAQALTEGPTRDRLVPCAPASASDAACARLALAPLAYRAWRREVRPEELDALVDVAVTAGATLGEFYAGLEYGVAAILQSPDFLYRPALGAGGAAGGALLGAELAARLSFFLWDTTPDDALLFAAARGDLETDAGLAREVDRLLADPRARQGLRAFVSDWLGLGQLSDLSKDTTLFPDASPELGPAAREETLRFVEYHVLDRDAPLPELLTSRETFVNRRLAALYEVPAPSLDGFGRVTLPEGERMGLLGQVSTLALHAHPVSTSPTLRGRFIRETLLCQTIAAPPVGVNTAIPEPSPDARTLRERLASHRASPACAGCHAELDPPGLGLERFDSVGRFRRMENGATIDPSGELDGAHFEGAAGLARALAEHPDFPTCTVRRVFRYATGRLETDDDAGALRALNVSFGQSGLRVRDLLRAVALSPAFRTARPLPTEEP